ncbi:mitochondrial genome maintenance [Chiua virens]|nr:mitochondrial genome maintenance [Chiua virens]
MSFARLSRVGISYHRTYATTTRTYPARATATSSRVTKASSSTSTNHISRDDISEAIADANGALENDATPETVPSTEPTSSRISQNAFPGDFISGGNSDANDWSKSYYGLSVEAFPREIADILLAPIDEMDVEMKPGESPFYHGLIYLPEIKYRRILNKAFGPGAWGLAPRTETNVGPKIVSREYALVCQGRLVAIARGENEYFDPSGIPTAAEGCKSNALMRCCKDLGIASELW